MLTSLRIRDVRNLSEVAKEHRHDDSTERDEFRGAPCKEELMSSASGKRDAGTKQSIKRSIRERENSSEMSLRKQHWTMNSSFPSIHLPWQQCHIVRLGTGDGLILGWGLCEQRFNHSRHFWAVCYCTAMLLFRVWLCARRLKTNRNLFFDDYLLIKMILAPVHCAVTMVKAWYLIYTTTITFVYHGIKKNTSIYTKTMMVYEKR